MKTTNPEFRVKARRGTSTGKVGRPVLPGTVAAAAQAGAAHRRPQQPPSSPPYGCRQASRSLRTRRIPG